MKLALPHPQLHTPHIHLSARAREVIFSLICTLLPYLIAAIGVFAYHEQFTK